MSYAPATRLTRVELDAARVITTGTVRIAGIIVCNAGASNREVIFRDADGTEILSVAVLAGTTVPIDIPWIVDNGLSIDSVSDSAVSVAVARGFEGA